MTTADRLNVAAIIAGVVALAACVITALFAVWTGDGRWGATALIAALVGFVLIAGGALSMDGAR